MTRKKRIAIFSFYDQEGVVDRYVEYLLVDLCHNLERLVIVCNGPLQAQMRSKLSVYTNCILERENEGFDIWGYKAGMELLGWEEISQYDELVLCNDSVIGPVYPFCEMFEEMDSKEIDFWGITKHYELDENPFSKKSGAKLMEHIQSYFMVFRQNVLRDRRFQEYWEQLPMLHSYEEAVGSHESIFTARLVDMGYAYDVYVDTDEYRDYTPNALRMCPDILVGVKRCPIIKKRIFIQDYGVTLHDMAGGAPARLMKQLEQDMGFDTDLIWEHILRVGKLDQITYNLHLQYILSGSSENGDVSNMAVIFLGSHPEESWGRLPQGVAAYTMSMEQFMSPETEEITRQYELICLLPEIAMDLEAPGSSTMDLQQVRYGNLICNHTYMLQIKECFRMHSRLGILYPPLPSHGSYVKNEQDVWWGGWFRREALHELMQTGIEGRKGNHHSLYAAVVYNQSELQKLLNNQSYYMEEYRHLYNEHKMTVQEWTRCMEAHDRVVAEWQQTDSQLKSYRDAHDRVVAEWTKTAEALKQLQVEYEALKEQKNSSGLAKIFKWGSK